MRISPWFAAVVATAFVVAGPVMPWTALAQGTYQGGSATEGMLNAPLPPTEPTTAHEVGAVFANVVHVPGKAILCGIGAVVGTTFMFLTFGSGYRFVVRTFEEGCGGTWVLTPEHLSGKTPYSTDGT